MSADETEVSTIMPANICPTKNSQLIEVRPQRFANAVNLVGLEKSLEQGGQDWIENVNIIEQLLVRVVDRLGQEHPSLKSKLIVRRLPTYLAPVVNENEYGIILENINFSVTPPGRPSSAMDKPGLTNFGQIEIFRAQDILKNSEGTSSRRSRGESDDSGVPEIADLVNEKQAYLSHELFKRFTSVFVEAYQTECDMASNEEDSLNSFQYSGEVQLLGSHLVSSIQETHETHKIFKLKQPPLPLPGNLKMKTSINVNYLKSLLTITYDGSEVVVRPCLFRNKGFPKANSNILERIPLHHPLYLQIGEALRKGVLLFPTSFDTLWTLQFWPSESHILSLYHPSSIICRIFKLYSSFCLNPTHFMETLSTTFIITMQDISIPEEDSARHKRNILNTDFMLSSFLFELENFCRIEDWAPRNFITRLMHLVRTAVDCYEKGFHAHYFTRINVLRGIWKEVGDFDKEEKSALRELDDVTCSQDDLDDYGEKAIIDMDDLADDFGFQFDDLETVDDEDFLESRSRPTSATIYRNLNPRRDSKDIYLGPGSRRQSRVKPERSASTLSRIFGTKFMKRLGRSDSTSTKGRKTPQSINDIASGFEESIAHMRRPESLRLRIILPSETLDDEDDIPEASSSSQHGRNRKSTASIGFRNEGFQGHMQSIYSSLLRALLELPSSEYLVDQMSVAELDIIKKVMESQEDLIIQWGKTCSELPKPKIICPHIFNQRQIQYISLVIQMVSKCSPNMVQIIKTSKLPAWEISGDILRTVLHQMRTEVAESDTLREKQKAKVYDKEELLKPKRKSTLSIKFSLRKKSAFSACEHDFVRDEQMGSNAQLALEEPEIAVTNRLLEWLWNLRCSEIGRLSAKAATYLEQLYLTSLTNSYFLEQISDEKVYCNMALKSAATVTRIMGDISYQVSVPLCAAAGKGWLWAEMILSLASWNSEKGYIMKTTIPVDSNDAFDPTSDTFLERVLVTENAAEKLSAVKQQQVWEDAAEPDLEATTLAFHSEMAVPIGWNDFEDPRRPGPYAVAILIFSSAWYFKHWEMSLGNIVQVLVRLQRFNSLQHIGQMLNPPHRKTALNEIRKLNKSLSLRIYDFHDNVMSKTFKRLNSLRATRGRMQRRENALAIQRRKYYSCSDVGCKQQHKHTVTTLFQGTELECTKL